MPHPSSAINVGSVTFWWFDHKRARSELRKELLAVNLGVGERVLSFRETIQSMKPEPFSRYGASPA